MNISISANVIKFRWDPRAAVCCKAAGGSHEGMMKNGKQGYGFWVFITEKASYLTISDSRR